MIEITRDPNFFSSKLATADNKTYSSDLNSAFQGIKYYLNNTLTEALDKAVAGLIAKPNFANNLLYINDQGSPEWRFVDNATINDYLIEFRHLSNSTPGSTIISGNSDGIIEFFTGLPNQVLFSDIQAGPKWRLVTNDDIVKDSLTGIQLGVLSADCFSDADSLFVTNVGNKQIKTIDIADFNITNAKLMSSTITSDKFGSFQFTFDTSKVQPKHFSDRSITGGKIADNSISIQSSFQSSMPLLPKYIKARSIPGDKFRGATKPASSSGTDGFELLKHWSGGTLTSKHYKKGALSLTDLEPAVQTVFSDRLAKARAKKA